MVVGHVKRSRNETHNDWPNGGAVAVNWKCKLWTGVTHALFDLQPCNFDTRMRLLMPNNFYILTFDLWPLDQPPFWIIWKTVKIPLLLGFLSNLQNNCLHMYFGPLRTHDRWRIFSKWKNEASMIQWILDFCENYSSAPNSSMQTHIFLKLFSNVEGYYKYDWNQSRSNWSKGGAIAIFWKCKL